MVKLLVLADDFTGALDTGVQFSNLGVETLVTTQVQLEQVKIPLNLEVLVVDTETRHVSDTAAYYLIHKLVEFAHRKNIPNIYKKVDSALRGNVPSEIKALVDASASNHVAFLPAFPEMNRVVRDGILYIDGLPVSESIFSEDPYEPVKESNILTRLKGEAGLDGILVKQGDEFAAQDPFHIFDAETDQDLKAIGMVLKEKGLLLVTVGCAGFAKILSHLLFKPTVSARSIRLKSLVVICGSVNEVTKNQVDYAQKQGALRVSLNSQQLFNKGYWTSQEGKNILSDILTKPGNQLLIFETFSEEISQEIKELVRLGKLNSEQIRLDIGQTLGDLTQQILTQAPDRTLLLTGGDTLFQTMGVLKITDVKPIVEYEPGIVFSEIVWQGQPYQVLTKSGGFGKESLFIALNQEAKE
ncbi:four-carbon acid sugar kinase family protein [Streptococcus sobrinus]|uniref:Putative ATP synthase F1, epsilon subunit n=3 Tax=Streptococcus sobrinus TaxID=1310 RepID=U2KMN2_9STRE|nr:four-carbon acid sugar kinase family protein [Streptococcus sobrinus]ERJ76068.1 putative ATP synthase F1, epsilon subunit [Streptococcus sobrinus W1703]OZV23232.1 hypothetical protein RO09_01750 [Streptococcus sobrinus]